MLIKGSMFLFLSPEAAYGALIAGFHFDQLFYPYMADGTASRHLPDLWWVQAAAKD